MKINNEFKIGVLIVLYNKELNESKTFISLLEQIKNKSIDKVIVWNNGPSPISCERSFFFDKEIKVINSSHNRSLSEIYNWFVDSENMDRYFIFDDDSIVEYDLRAVCQKYDFELCIPKIIDSGKEHYPMSYKGEIIDNVTSQKLLSISSGLCLSKELVTKLKDNYGTVFDERFKFYGVDTTFFFRLYKLDKVIIKICGTISHSLSKNKKESNDVHKFRMRERVKDLALQTRYYRELISIKASLGIIYNSIKSGKFEFVALYFRFLFFGVDY